MIRIFYLKRDLSLWNKRIIVFATSIDLVIAILFGTFFCAIVSPNNSQSKWQNDLHIYHHACGVVLNGECESVLCMGTICMDWQAVSKQWKLLGVFDFIPSLSGHLYFISLLSFWFLLECSYKMKNPSDGANLICFQEQCCHGRYKQVVCTKTCWAIISIVYTASRMMILLYSSNSRRPLV